MPHRYGLRSVLRRVACADRRLISWREYRCRTRQAYRVDWLDRLLRQTTTEGSSVAPMPGLWNPPRATPRVAIKCSEMRRKNPGANGRADNLFGSSVLEW